MRALNFPKFLHGAVEQSFKGERRRNLWRIDWLDDTCYLLVLSPRRPNFAILAQQFGYLNSEKGWETKNYDSLLMRLQLGQSWRFRLCANPTRRSGNEREASSGRGKVFAHVTTEQQKKWLLSRAENWGFSLEEDKFDVVNSQWKNFKKGKDGRHEVSIHTVTFEGILTISDVERFKQTLLSGVGRAKAYGCGMITIAR
jgi:CRISPR system Cascade subunit CasE